MPAAVAMPMSMGGSASAGPSYSPRSVSARSQSYDHERGRSQQQQQQQQGQISHDEDYEGDEGEDEDDDAGTDDGMGGAQATGAGGQEIISETTVRSGYLYKRGEKRKNWKKRWFVLRSSKLFYYKNDKEYQLLRFIDMADVHTVAPVNLKKVEHSFGIVTSKRQYYVRASSAKEMHDWVDALRRTRELVRQTSTLTHDAALLDVSGHGGQDGTGSALDASASKNRAADAKNVATPSKGAASQQGAGSAAHSGQSSPISIVIPGKGLYSKPAHPPTSAGGTVMSPLTATSDSETGAHSGAEQFGLSYASSTGHSFGSSPGRAQQKLSYTTGASSPVMPGAEEDNGRRGQSTLHKQYSRNFRDASVGSSAGDQHLENKTTLLSSSDEDGEGDEWDEDEEADRAMPLPGHASGSALSSLPASSSGAGSTMVAASPGASDLPPGTKPKVSTEFFKDPNKIIHQGYLMKQSSHRKHWRKRWFTLTSGHLSYSRSHMDARAHRQIPLTSILDAIEYTPKKPAPAIVAPLSPNSGSNVGSGSGSAASAQTPGGSNPSSSLNSAISFARGTRGGQNNDAGAGDDGAAGKSAEMATSQGSSSTSPPIAERRTGVTPSLSLGNAPSFMSMPGAIGGVAGSGKRKKENCFKIITPKRTFLVCAPTEEDELRWLSALQALLAHWRDSQEATGSSSTADKGPAAEATSAATQSGSTRQRSDSGTMHQHSHQAFAPSSTYTTPAVTSPGATQSVKNPGLSRLQTPPSVSVTRPQDAYSPSGLDFYPQQSPGVPTTASSAATITPGNFSAQTPNSERS